MTGVPEIGRLRRQLVSACSRGYLKYHGSEGYIVVAAADIYSLGLSSRTDRTVDGASYWRRSKHGNCYIEGELVSSNRNRGRIEILANTLQPILAEDFPVILIKCFKARCKREHLFNYRKTRRYTCIRIEHADKKQCEALESLLDPRKRQYPLYTMLRNCQLPTLYSLVSLVPVIGGLLMALVGTALVYRCLSQPGGSRSNMAGWRCQCKHAQGTEPCLFLVLMTGMEKLRRDQTLFLLLTALITQVTIYG
jgi:hypothetical protein